ncbi:polysaccharide deacetylase family protein [Paenibacillus sp. 481]|uniref:polysaccharide deacetylase family protein n=1 Tax=Paenibacillus sp. 481 TaxID=2835869 RepID=UPI001E3B83DA|nr:polysaccharide deacetylase family protein [Paenibacillus sp. 481]
MKRVAWKWLIIVATFTGVIVTMNVTGVGDFLKERKASFVMHDAFRHDEWEVMQQDPLAQRIMQESKQFYVAPINARIDRVWRAIPGYNGLEVDLEQTYAVNKDKDKQSKLEWVFREIEPEITLSEIAAEPIYRGNPNKPMAALMINVAWGNEFIDPILEVLNKKRVKATFFFDGSWLAKNKVAAKRIQSQGHELENHAYTHPKMNELSAGLQRREIERTKKLLSESLGVINRWFAPPSGAFNQTTVKIAHELNLKTVLWTFDTIDWKKPEPAQIVRRLRPKVEAGMLILMHPTSASSRALSDMIDVITSKKLQLGTVSETLSERRAPLVEPR